MKESIVVLISFFVLLFVFGCTAEDVVIEKPPVDVVANALEKKIAKIPGNVEYKFTYKVLEYEITNSYTLQRGGETLHCNDIKAIYVPEELESISPKMSFEGVVRIVKRGINGTASKNF